MSWATRKRGEAKGSLVVSYRAADFTAFQLACTDVAQLSYLERNAKVIMIQMIQRIQRIQRIEF